MQALIFDYVLVNRSGEYFTGVIEDGLPQVGSRQYAYRMTVVGCSAKTTADPRYAEFTIERVS